MLAGCIPEVGVNPFSMGDLLGNVCSEADLPWLLALPCVFGDLESSRPPVSSPPASDPIETMDIDLLCLCPIPPLAPEADTGDVGGTLPAGTLSESDGLCAEVGRPDPAGILGLTAPERAVVAGSCDVPALLLGRPPATVAPTPTPAPTPPGATKLPFVAGRP